MDLQLWWISTRSGLVSAICLRICPLVIVLLELPQADGTAMMVVVVAVVTVSMAVAVAVAVVVMMVMVACGIPRVKDDRARGRVVRRRGATAGDEIWGGLARVV